MSKQYTDEELREINKKHDASVGNNIKVSNKLYSSVYEGKKKLGTAWSKRYQGPPYSTAKDKL